MSTNTNQLVIDAVRRSIVRFLREEQQASERVADDKNDFLGTRARAEERAHTIRQLADAIDRGAVALPVTTVRPTLVERLRERFWRV